MMPGGSPEAYEAIKEVVSKVAAQVDDGPCVTYIGKGGSGNFVKMVHNGIEYGDMQLIAEAYDVLKTLGARLEGGSHSRPPQRPCACAQHAGQSCAHCSDQPLHQAA